MYIISYYSIYLVYDRFAGLARPTKRKAAFFETARQLKTAKRKSGCGKEQAQCQNAKTAKRQNGKQPKQTGQPSPDHRRAPKHLFVKVRLIFAPYLKIVPFPGALSLANIYIYIYIYMFAPLSF